MLTKYSGIIKVVSYVLLAALILGLVYWVIDLKHDSEIAELNKQMERAEQTAKFREQIEDKDGIEHYLREDNKSLANRLEMEQIKLKQINSIISQVLKYRDTASRSTDLSPLIDAITKNVPAQKPWIDSTACLVVKGNVNYENGKLSVNVTERDFNNKSDVVGYWERREWKFLFWKTRFLGKKEVTAKSFSDCGDVRTVRIEKKP